MRITIETTGAESQSIVMYRDNGDTVIGGKSAPEAAPPTDAGPPPETLLLALEAETETGAKRQTTSSDTNVTKVDGPPAWLRDVIDGGAADLDR
jgi:hypothetical protein